ncbi:MAG: hypothetical protein KBE38_10525, partial [Ignavibacterium sp.]|nr:hypothetical protein [Ignavibacterium sp.]
MNTDSGSSNSEYCRSDKYNSRENIKNGRSDKYKSRGNIRNSRNEKDNSRCNFENGRSNFNECGCYFNICKSDFDKFRKVFESQGFFYHTLTLSCQEVVQKFVQAARRAVSAGFDAIELHATHGYLMNEFLSPLANQRTDEYGGSLENRVRLLKEVLVGVKAVIPADMPIIVRVSADDYHEAGNTPVDVADMLNLIKDDGIDLVNVSSGAVISLMPRVFPGYQIPMALTIKQKTGLPILGGGLITEPMQALQLVKAGVDLVYTGRVLLRNPYWPLQAAHILQQEVEWPA